MRPVSLGVLADIVGGEVEGDPQTIVATTGEARELLRIPGAATADNSVVVDDVEDAMAGLGVWLREEHEAGVVALVGLDPRTAERLRTALATQRQTTLAPPVLAVPDAVAVLCGVQAHRQVLLCPVDALDPHTLAELSALLRPDAVVHATPTTDDTAHAVAALAADRPPVVAADHDRWPAAVAGLATAIGIPAAPVVAAWEATA